MERGLQKYNIPELSVTNIGDSNRSGAIWEVSYDYSGKNVFYLTDEEKNFFLKALANGANFVDVKGYVLSNKFLTIRLCEDKYREYSRYELAPDEMYAPDGTVVKIGGKND